MKRKIAFLGAAVVALMAAGAAQAGTGAGYVGVNYNGSDEDDANSWGVNGAAVLDDSATGFNIQVDGAYNTFNDLDANVIGIGMHAFTRSENWLVGAYAGYDTVDDDSNTDINEWTVAAQTQFYMDRITLSADLSYGGLNLLGEDLDTTQIDGEVRYFATDNFSVQGNVGFGKLDSDFGDGNFNTYGAGAEWKLDASPISFVAGVQNFDPENGDSSTSYSVGVRYAWGGSLLERNRSGAGLNQPQGFLAALF